MGAMKDLVIAVQDLLDKHIDEAEIARLLGCSEDLVWDIEVEYLAEEDPIDSV